MAPIKSKGRIPPPAIQRHGAGVSKSAKVAGAQRTEPQRPPYESFSPRSLPSDRNTDGSSHNLGTETMISASYRIRKASQIINAAGGPRPKYTGLSPDGPPQPLGAHDAASQNADLNSSWKNGTDGQDGDGGDGPGNNSGSGSNNKSDEGLNSGNEDIEEESRQSDEDASGENDIKTGKKKDKKREGKGKSIKKSDTKHSAGGHRGEDPTNGGLAAATDTTCSVSVPSEARLLQLMTHGGTVGFLRAQSYRNGQGGYLRPDLLRRIGVSEDKEEFKYAEDTPDDDADEE